MRINITTQGNRTAIQALGRATENFIEFLEDEVMITTDNIQDKAVSRVAVNTGLLKSSIYKNQQGLNSEVGATKKYAPYVEFGTGGLVDVPQGLEDYAIQFRGRNMATVSLPANPFLFNSAFEEVQAMTRRVNEATINSR